jgi:type IV secretory pathway VirJ component
VVAALAGAALLEGFTPRSEAECADRIPSLPLVERPPLSDTNPTLVVLLTGDGGWAASDEGVARALVQRGAAVIGLNMRSYLGTQRSPDVAGADVECVTRRYLTLWSRERLMLLGYSRGADILPFVASRLSPDLRDRINMVALVSLSSRADFHFHWMDLVRDVRRPDDLPVAPELAKLRGLNVVCVYGNAERDSGCRDADSTVVTRYAREGGHRLGGGFRKLEDILSQGLRPAAAALRR